MLLEAKLELWLDMTRACGVHPWAATASNQSKHSVLSRLTRWRKPDSEAESLDIDLSSEDKESELML